MMHLRFFLPVCSALAVLLTVSCKEKETNEAPDPKKAAETKTAKPADQAPAAAPSKSIPNFWDKVKVHAAIREVNADYTGNAQIGIDPQGQPRQIGLRECRISDLSWVAGMPALEVLDLSENQGLSDIGPLKALNGLRGLYLENTSVKDLAPLKSKRLEEFYLTGTLVKDLTPLSTMQVSKLNLVKTPVTELKGLAGAQIGLLWLTDSPVNDISGLEKVVGLESVTLHRTKISDLSPLSKGQYPKGLRLHIGETPVKDLSPLATVPLTRLVFTPGTIEKGLDAVKQIPSLREIGTQFEDGPDGQLAKDLVPPPVFWQNFGK